MYLGQLCRFDCDTIRPIDCVSLTMPNPIEFAERLGRRIAERQEFAVLRDPSNEPASWANVLR